MELLVMIEGDALQELLNLCAAAREGGTYRLRIAVDGGYLKMKRNEGTWTPPLGLVTTGESAQ